MHDIIKIPKVLSKPPLLSTNYLIFYFVFLTLTRQIKDAKLIMVVYFFKIFFIYIKKKTMNCSNQPCLTIFYFLFIFIFSFLHNTFDFFFYLNIYMKDFLISIFYSFIFSNLLTLIIYIHFKHKIIIYINN